MRHIIISLAILLGVAQTAEARFYMSPYVSVSSKKKIKPADAGKESSNTSQRTTYGIRAGLGLGKLFRLQLSVGRAQLDKSEKVSKASDDLEEIDYEEDLNMSTDDPDALVNTKEIQDKARLTAILDPGFWIFIARAKAGVQASQRKMSLTQGGETSEFTTPIKYSPLAGAGLGIRLGRMMKAMAEYTLIFTEFPEEKPFEREVSVSFSINI